MLGALLKRHGYEYFYTKDFEQSKDGLNNEAVKPTQPASGQLE